jgi:hypothetical protein
LVSQALRGSADGKKPGKKRGRKPGSKNKVVAAAKTAKSAKAANTDTSFGSLKAAADFVRSSGSAESALQAIRDYQKIAALING